MNKDQVAGRIEEAKGKAAEIAGKVVGKKDLDRMASWSNSTASFEPAMAT